MGVKYGLNTDPATLLYMRDQLPQGANWAAFGISRAEQDEFALRSNHRAEAAMNNGIFKEEIIPVFNNDEKKMIY
jgi:hypothetical protein